jgi:hypothetical protein
VSSRSWKGRVALLIDLSQAQGSRRWLLVRVSRPRHGASHWLVWQCGPLGFASRARFEPGVFGSDIGYFPNFVAIVTVLKPRWQQDRDALRMFFEKIYINCENLKHTESSAGTDRSLERLVSGGLCYQ